MRTLSLFFIFGLIIAAVAASFVITEKSHAEPDWQVTDHTGQPFAVTDTGTPYTLLFFGFTSCPDVCGIGLGKMLGAMDELGTKGANDITPVFVTIDPARDDVDVMQGFVKDFDPRLTGITGPVAEIDKMMAHYFVWAEKNVIEGTEEYLIDHSSFIYFLDDQGEILEVFKHTEDSPAIAEEIRPYL